MASLPLAALLAGAVVLSLAVGWWAAAWFQRRMRADRDRARRQSGALRRARQTQQALLDHSDALVFTLDPQGRYQSMNRFGLEYLGTSLQEITGKYVEEHLDEKSAPLFRDLLRQALAEGQARGVRQKFSLGGRERYLDLHLKVIGSPWEDSRLVLVIIHDQTEQKLMEDRLWQTEKLASLGLLAAGVAHQINNPLGILMGFCELLQDKCPPGEEGHRELEIIYQQGRQCQRIVEGLLNFTRLSDLGTGHGDLLAGLRSVLEVLGRLLEQRGIELELELPPHLPPSAADAGAMQQVFLNIIANALDAMPQGGRLFISAGLKTKPPRQGTRQGTLPPGPSYIEVIIEDSGPGIAPEHLERIYDPFFTTKPVGQGTGLGLSVAYGLVREYQGTIACQSPPPGREEPGGTRFTIRLPVSRLAQPPEQDRDPAG